MKKKILLPAMLLCFGWQLSVYAQTSVDITGIIKTPQGSAMKGADVNFHGPNDEFLGNCVSGPDGKFRSQNKIQVGRLIKIRVISSEYSLTEQKYTVDKTGNAGEIRLNKKSLSISGFVADSVSEKPLPDVEVFYYAESKLVHAGSTNSQGYFDIETNFTPGQKITIRLSRESYYPIEQTTTFAKEGINTIANIFLPRIDDRGLKVSITVLNKKNNPIAGANIHYIEAKRGTYLDTSVDRKGKVELKLKQQPGTELTMEISKGGYATRLIKQTLAVDLSKNSYTYYLEKKKSMVSTLLLVGGSTAAIVSGGMYFSSNSKYDSYKDFANANREGDYDLAQSRRNISLAAGAVAIGSLAVYFIYNSSRKNKTKKTVENDKRGVFRKVSLSSPSYNTARTHFIGLTYHF